MERVQLYLTKSEVQEYEDFKKLSGMTYKAFVSKAIEYYLAPSSPYLNESVKPAYQYNERKGKIRKNPPITDKAYERLTYYCALHDFSISSVAERAIFVYIRDKKDMIL